MAAGAAQLVMDVAEAATLPSAQQADAVCVHNAHQQQQRTVVVDVLQLCLLDVDVKLDSRTVLLCCW